MRKSVVVAAILFTGGGGLVSSAHAQGLPVMDDAAEISDAAIALESATTAANTLSQLKMLTSTINVATTLATLDGDSLRNPLPTAASMPGQLVTESPSTTQARALYTANNTEASTDSAEADREAEMLSVASNLDSAALQGLGAFEKQAAQDAAEKSMISTSASAEALLATNAVLERQQIINERQTGQMAAVEVLATAQEMVNQANARESQEQDHEKTAALFSAVP